MKIAYIISRYPAVSHTFIQREILGLRAAGLDITTISVRRADAAHLLTAVDRDEADRTHVLVGAPLSAFLVAFFAAIFSRPLRVLTTLTKAWKLHRPGIKGSLWSFFYFLEAILTWHICHTRGVRHLHAHFANVASDVALLACHLGGSDYAYSFTMHGPTEFADITHHRLAQKTAAARFVICISDFARSQLMALVDPTHWPKLRIIHCGVDPATYTFTPRTPGNMPEILCVGRLVSVKAQSLLLEAFAALPGNCRLTLVGDGPDRARLTTLAQSLGITERVTFTGNVGQDDIRAHYQRASLFVLPSFAEGVPVVLMEAMASGVPVISTLIAGIPELIEHNRTGLLVPPGRVDLLTHAIQQLLADHTRITTMTHAAREKICSDFDIHMNTRRLATIFREFAATSPAHVAAAPQPSLATGAP